MIGSERWNAVSERPTSDLVSIGVLTTLAIVVVLAGEGWYAPLRVILVVPLLCVLPGYAFLLALYPETVVGATEESWQRWTPGVAHGREPAFDTVARAAVSIGASFALSVFAGLLLNWTPWSITATTVTLVVGSVTLVLTGVAWLRSRRSSPRRRDAGAAHKTTGRMSGPKLAVSVLLCVCLVGGILGVTLTAPAGGESLTELGVATDSGTYPLEVEDSGTAAVTLSNHEGHSVAYVVRSTLTWQPADAVGNAMVYERWRYTLADDETVRFRYTVRPADGADSGRVVFRLYRDDATDDPTTGEAYRTVALDIAVTENASNET